MRISLLLFIQQLTSAESDSTVSFIENYHHNFLKVPEKFSTDFSTEVLTSETSTETTDGEIIPEFSTPLELEDKKYTDFNVPFPQTGLFTTTHTHKDSLLYEHLVAMVFRFTEGSPCMILKTTCKDCPTEIDISSFLETCQPMTVVWNRLEGPYGAYNILFKEEGVDGILLRFKLHASRPKVILATVTNATEVERVDVLTGNVMVRSEKYAVWMSYFLVTSLIVVVIVGCAIIVCIGVFSVQKCSRHFRRDSQTETHHRSTPTEIRTKHKIRGLKNAQILFPVELLQNVSGEVKACFGVENQNIQSSPSWWQAVENECICVICTDLLLADDPVRVLTCKHVFHVSCIDDWFRKHSDCPICRMDFLVEDKALVAESENKHASVIGSPLLI